LHAERHTSGDTLYSVDRSGSNYKVKKEKKSCGRVPSSPTHAGLNHPSFSFSHLLIAAIRGGRLLVLSPSNKTLDLEGQGRAAKERRVGEKAVGYWAKTKERVVSYSTGVKINLT